VLALEKVSRKVSRPIFCNFSISFIVALDTLISSILYFLSTNLFVEVNMRQTIYGDAPAF
jgi:hypothetical protein